MATTKRASKNSISSMQYNPTELYWRDIKDAEPLSREKEIELFQCAKAGDDQAQAALAVGCLKRLAIHLPWLAAIIGNFRYRPLRRLFNQGFITGNGQGRIGTDRGCY